MLPQMPANSPTRPPRPPVVLPPLSGPYSPARPALLPGPAQRPLTSQAPNQPMRPIMSPPSRWALCCCVMKWVEFPIQDVIDADACELCPALEGSIAAVRAHCSVTRVGTRSMLKRRTLLCDIHDLAARGASRRRASRPASGVLKKHCNCKNSRCLKLCALQPLGI